MKNSKHLEEFVNEFKLNRKDRGPMFGVTIENMAQLKSYGCTVEELLNYMAVRHSSLFHGSITHIRDGFLVPQVSSKFDPPFLYATNSGAVAIMKAIISNRKLKKPGLVYPYYLDDDTSFEVKIHGIRKDTIHKKGYVYIINRTDEFRNIPSGSWQYQKIKGVTISAMIEVERSDFTYPIIDVKRNRRVE